MTDNFGPHRILLEKGYRFECSLSASKHEHFLSSKPPEIRVFVCMGGQTGQKAVEFWRTITETTQAGCADHAPTDQLPVIRESNTETFSIGLDAFDFAGVQIRQGFTHCPHAIKQAIGTGVGTGFPLSAPGSSRTRSGLHLQFVVLNRTLLRNTSRPFCGGKKVTKSDCFEALARIEKFCNSGAKKDFTPQERGDNRTTVASSPSSPHMPAGVPAPSTSMRAFRESVVVLDNPWHDAALDCPLA
jgi:hypothetical protein